MPTFEQAAFLGLAVGSLLAQTLADWELVVVDDGSADATADELSRWAGDPRIRLHRHPVNRGLGAALNTGLDLARAPLVAYLPSDDLYDAGHLATLVAALDDAAVLVYSGMRRLPAGGGPPQTATDGLQLVQVLHRRTADRWVEREEFESDDLELLLWGRLRRRGAVRATGRVTCTWTDHPDQRHKRVRERYDGGLNVFRSRYRVPTPLRLHSSDSGLTDEVSLYRRFRSRPMPAPGPGSLRVLLAGELSYHPERVLALAERGVRLYGLWTRQGLGIDTVGPLPFGHVTDLPAAGWADAVRRLRPHVIYGQLNWRAVPFVTEVARACPQVPLVWHFKESPQRCLVRGEWPLLAELCIRADALVLSSPEERAWFDLALPGRLDPDRTLVLDGSLPKADWFTGPPARRLSETDGEVHTCVAGRPLGIDERLVATLAAHRVHLHVHGLTEGPGPQGAWARWLGAAQRAAGDYLHVHPAVDQRGWRPVLSRYDAGWMHVVRSGNGGDLRRATWDDLNYPARIGTYLVAGLPLLQPESPGGVAAVDRLVAERGIGVRYRDAEDACAQLTDASALAAVRAQVARQRLGFAFDSHADALLALFHKVVEARR